MKMMSHMIGRNISGMQLNNFPPTRFNAAQNRDYPDDQSQQNVNDQD